MKSVSMPLREGGAGVSSSPPKKIVYCKHGNFHAALIFVHQEACGNLSTRENNAHTLFINC